MSQYLTMNHNHSIAVHIKDHMGFLAKNTYLHGTLADYIVWANDKVNLYASKSI